MIKRLALVIAVLSAYTYALSVVIALPESKIVRLADAASAETVVIFVSADVPVKVPEFDGTNYTVAVTTKNVRCSGSGVFITSTGDILSCAHLIWDGKVTSITIQRQNGDTYCGVLQGRDDTKDLALFKIYEKHTPYIALADPRSLKVGQEVFAVGEPLGFDYTISHGIISALNRDRADYYNYTQSDCFINPGNSGGPLINLNGELVGINSRMSPPVNAPIFTGLGFSVSPAQIIEFVTTCGKTVKGLPKYNMYYFSPLGRFYRWVEGVL